MSVSSFSHLPIELLTPICNHLSRRDQRTLRLVSHRLNTIAQPALFQTVFLKLHLRSFEHLEAISQHAGLSKHVRTLCFDPRQLREPAWSVGFDYWCDHILGSGMQGEARSAARSAEPQVLHVYFLAYRDFMEGFKSLVTRRKWAGMLYSCVQNLPALSQIYYTEGQSQSALRLFQDLDDGLGSMEPDARLMGEICAVPDLPSSYDTGFWSVLNVISGTRAAGRITKISGLDIDSSTWARRRTGLKEIVRQFPNLRDLALTFENSHNTYKEDYVHVPEILAAATELRSLYIRNRYGRDPDYPNFGRRVLDVGDVVISPQYLDLQVQMQSHWLHLQELDLFGLNILQTELRSLVAAHASTLRYLRLSHVEIGTFCFQPEDALQAWNRLINLLAAACTTLECVVFDEVNMGNVLVGNGDGSVPREFWEGVMDDVWYVAGVRADLKQRYLRREEFATVWRERRVNSDPDIGDHCEQERDGVLKGWIFSNRSGGRLDKQLQGLTLS